MSTEYRRIKNRRDTSAGWIEKNPVLLEGELGLETDTRKIKFGDGVNYWIDLPYSGVDSQEITDIVTSISYTKQEVDQIVNTVEGSIPTDTSDLTNGAGYITINDVPAQQQADWTEVNTTVGSYIKNKPNLATVATSGDYDDLTNKPTIPTDTSDLTNGAGFITLNDVPAQQQADWTEVNTTVGSYIKNKPNLATVATSGSYNDLNDKPSIPTNTSDLNNDSGFITINDVPAQQQANWTETNTTLGSYIQNKPNLATVATSGSYTDLSNTPTIPTDTSDLTNNAGFITINDVPAQQQANWTETNTTLGSYIQNKPTLATVATSGDYTDLTNKPTIPTDTSDLTNGAGFITLNEVPGQLQADWNEVNTTLGSYIQNKPTVYNEWFGTQQEYDAIVVKDADTIYHIEGGATVTWNEVVGKPTFAAVATSGDYNDLINTPTFTQVQSDWTEVNTTLGSYIQNKPTLATVATSGDYTDLTNTPTIPTVNDATVTFTQGGVTKGSVTLNQGTDATIALDAGGGTQVNADWNESDPTDPAYIENKPTIPAAQVNSDWNSDSGKSEIYNKPRMGVETLTFTLSDQSTVSIDVWVRTPNYFYVEDISGNNNTLSIVKNDASAPTIEVFKSTDMKNWTSMGNTDTTPITATIPANGKLYLKATADGWYNSSTYRGNTITASGNHNVGGNIMSLLKDDNFEGTSLDTNYIRQFNVLFYQNTKLVDASKLQLPDNVTNRCYTSMFYGCTSLTAAPVTLPATDLTGADYCYQYMFMGCTSLTTAPTLPATTLSQYCYQSMFKGCTALTTAPALPATTLASSCYEELFSGCTALTTAPALPATDLTGANNCYLRLFWNCTSLVNAPTLPATTLSNLCYMCMFQGCTSLVNAPTLPATTLASQCYADMFYGCTSLVNAPVLPATTPTQYCYYELFYGCTSLNRVECYANTMNSNYMNNWLYNTAAQGDFYNLGGATATYGIPSGWTVHTSL